MNEVNTIEVSDGTEELELGTIVNQDWDIITEISKKKFKINKKIKEDISLEKTEIVNTEAVISTESILKVENKIEKEVKKEVKEVNVKSFVVGLSNLFYNKSIKLLNAINFMLDNSKVVSIALLHMIIPLIMTYFLVNKVNFIALQMAKETYIMYGIYSIIFYFASIFTWVLIQVLAFGIFALLKSMSKEIVKASLD